MKTKQLVLARDILFWLYEVGATAELSGQAAAETSQAEVESMLDAVSELVDAEFDGLPELLDEQEPSFNGETVVTPPRLKTALANYNASGFASAAFASEWGGLDLPYAVHQALMIPVNAVGGSAMGYVFLTNAAASMLSIVGNEAQKARYLPKLVSGEWFGTMMLSEPQAGSSLGDIRTKAVLQADGSYHLSGSKMWISAGDHELADNIIHMVLAKIVAEDGSTQPGSRGISLFLVPKFLVNEDGSLGDRNGIQLAGINHKMGNRGTVNTVPVLGENSPCTGYLLGTAGKGLAGMFHMMNEARIGVGMGAAQLGYYGYRYALGYALERPQGRPLQDPDPSKPQVNIIEHTDVKRMLLQQKALAEGAMALCLYAAELVDKSRADAKQERAEQEPTDYEQLLAFLTPIVKSWPSVWGLHANYLAIQVLGGYGYTREYPLERFYRDNRLNEIHEGTTGIQSLDLLGRKALQDNGAALRLLLQAMQATAAEATEIESLKDYSEALQAAGQRIAKTTQVLAGEAMAGRHAEFLANSAVYLELCGHTVVAWMWLRMAVVAAKALPTAAEADKAFYQGKLRACQYFFRWELPKTRAQAELLQSLDDTCLQAQPEEF